MLRYKVPKWDLAMIQAGYYNFQTMITRVISWFQQFYAAIEVPIIIFVGRKLEAEEVAHAIQHHTCMSATFIHGDVSADARIATQRKLQAGELDVVVATSAWSTGIDIPEIRTVVRTSGGSAPTGLKQQSGRGARLAAGKNKFAIWDLAAPNDHHIKERISEYTKGGYEVENFYPGRESTKATRITDVNTTATTTRKVSKHHGMSPTDVDLYGVRRSFIGTGGPFIDGFESTILLLVTVLIILIALGY